MRRAALAARDADEQETASDLGDQRDPAVEPGTASRRSDFRRHLVEHSVTYLLLAAGSIAMLFPFAWMIGTSLKIDRELFVTRRSSSRIRFRRKTTGLC